MMEGSPPIPTIDARQRFAWVGRLRANESLMGVARNTGWLLGDRLVRAALGFLVGAWVARYLGPNRFGQFAYVIAFISFFQAVASLGADNIVVRDVSREPMSAPEVLGSILRLRLVSGFACWVAAVALMALLNPGSGETIAMTAVVGGVLVFQAADTVDLWFQSQTQSRRAVVAKLTAYALTNGIKVIFVLVGAPLWAFATAFLFDFVAAAIALAIAYRRFPTTHFWSFDITRAKLLLRQSWPFMLSGVSIIVYMRIDQIMLKAYEGDRALGIYAAALPLSQIWQMIPLTLAISLGPIIARKKLENQAAYESTLLAVFRLFGMLSMFVSVATAIGARVVVPFIYGPQFIESSEVLAIHVFSNVFVALGVAQGLWLINEPNGGRISLFKTIAGGVVAILGNWIMIPAFGVRGAAIVAVGSFATSAMLCNLLLAPRIFVMQLGIRASK